MAGKRFIWPERGLSSQIETRRNKKGTDLTLSLISNRFLAASS